MFCIRHVEDLIVLLACLRLAYKKFSALPRCLYSVPTHTHTQTDGTIYMQHTIPTNAKHVYVYVLLCLCVCVWGVDFCLLRWQSTSIYAISSFWLNWFSVTISIQRESVCVSVWFTIWLFYLAILLGLVLASICKYLYKHIEGEVLLPSLVLHRFVSCIWPKNASGIKSFLILRMYPMQHALSRLRKGGEGQPLLELVILRGSLRK